MNPEDLALLAQLTGQGSPQADPTPPSDGQLMAEILRQHAAVAGSPIGSAIDPDQRSLSQLYAAVLRANGGQGSGPGPMSDAFFGDGLSDAMSSGTSVSEPRPSITPQVSPGSGFAPQPPIQADINDLGGQSQDGSGAQDPRLIPIASRYPPVPPANRSPPPAAWGGSRPRTPGVMSATPEGGGAEAGDFIDSFEQFISGPEYDHAANIRSDAMGLRRKFEATRSPAMYADVDGKGVTADTYTYSDPDHTAFVKLPSFGPEGFSMYEMRDGPKGRQWTSGDGQWHDLRTDPPFIRPLNNLGR